MASSSLHYFVPSEKTYSYRLPISVSFKNSSTASVSLSSLKRSTTFSRAPRSLRRCPRFLFFPVILSTLFLRARHSRFHARHPPNKCPRDCFLPESHHQQASDSFFFIRTRWVPMRACPDANWRKTAALRFGIFFRAARICFSSMWGRDMGCHSAVFSLACGICVRAKGSVFVALSGLQFGRKFVLRCPNDGAVVENAHHRRR
jgi:hypothetical protein